ncbi:MAG: hypothetical protein M1320_01695 [Patescibacteria group bacterium]|nr:hypothetical protein [Patescibacteria group bacterium]
MANNIVAGELYESITGQLFEIGRQLRQNNGYPFNAQLLRIHLQNAIEGKFNTLVDPRFEFIKQFKLTVPTDYNHASQLATFAKDHKKEFYSYDDNITDTNFAKATNKLVPGKTYTVKIFGIKQTIQSRDGLGLVVSQKGILAGAQGVSLVYQLAKDELPKDNKSYLSFDEESALSVGSFGYHRVPGVRHYVDDTFAFGLGDFGHAWDSGNCVLCFCNSDDE